MSHTPLISIALCTYNGEKYLADQLESILNQTYHNLEIIIVDDCSTDQTAAIVETYADKDHRIRFVRNDSTLGFVKNFQKAVKECRGELIALSDQDDVWLPEKIDTLYRELGNNLLIYSEVRLMDAHGSPLQSTFPSVRRIEGSCALSLLLDNCVTGHACLMRRELLNHALPFPEGIFAHDQWLAIVAAAQGRLRASNQALSWYRAHSNNTLLSTKKVNRSTKAIKARNKNLRLLRLEQALLQTNLLGDADQDKLIKFLQLLKLNNRMFYNWHLSHFLKHHQSDFLQLYHAPERQIKKVCRGYWYYRLLPFL